MIQLLTRATFGANYAVATAYSCLGGVGLTTTGWNNSPDVWRVPISEPGSFSNLVVLAPLSYQSHPPFSITVLKNGVATTLTTSLSGSDTTNQDIDHTFTVVAGDDFSLQLSGSSVGYPGYDIFVVCDFTPDDADTSIYGIPCSSGSVANQHGWLGGALGNGSFQIWDFTSPSSLSAYSNTYSIASSPGNLTRLDLKSFRGQPGALVWKGWIRLNKVIQDGTNGTVDTTVTLTGTDTSAFSTFALPIVEADHVEIAIELVTGTASFNIAGIAAGCKFTSSNPGEFMFCGGNNNALSNTTENFIYTGTQQLATPEARVQVPIGINGLNVEGIYVEHLSAPGGVGKGWIDTVRKNGVDTAVTVTVENAATTGFIRTPVSFVFGDVIDIGYNPFGAPNNSQFHWGFAFTVTEPEPPPPDTESGPLSGIYFLSPGKTNDTIYQTILLNTTTGNIVATTGVVAIPNPNAYTAMLGDE